MTDTETLLRSGGDSRLDVHPRTLLNRYGCRFAPEPGLLSMGSCTASTIGQEAFLAADSARANLAKLDGRPLEVRRDEMYEDIRESVGEALLRGARASTDIVLMPSGTDAEYVALLLAAGQSDRCLLNIVTAPGEVGSGSVPACAGLHFDQLLPSGRKVAPNTPVDASLARRVAIGLIQVREPDGKSRDPAEIDRDVEVSVSRAVRDNMDVLVHVVAHSKTGAFAPSPDLVDQLEREYGSRVHVIVDAAQGRISRRGLARVLTSGRMVIVTGSKFYGGPPFAGLLLIPESYIDGRRAHLECPAGFASYFTSELAPRTWTGWRRSLPIGHNPGLLLRWAAGAREMDLYYRVNAESRFAILRAYEDVVSSVLSEYPRLVVEDPSHAQLKDEMERVLESKRTVFTFGLRDKNGVLLDADALRTIQGTLRRPSDVGRHRPAGRGFETGQPVMIGTEGRAALRIALGAPLLRQYTALEDPPAQIRTDTHDVVKALLAAADRSDA